jgi:hypothetical protein
MISLPTSCGALGRGQKRCYFQKRTGEVAENKGSEVENEPERTGKRSGEVVENTLLWKKRTENEPENKSGPCR